MPRATVSIEARTARLRAQMSLQLLHDSHTTADIKMLIEWAIESVANPTTVISMSRKWDLFSMHGRLQPGNT